MYCVIRKIACAVLCSSPGDGPLFDGIMTVPLMTQYYNWMYICMYIWSTSHSDRQIFFGTTTSSSSVVGGLFFYFFTMLLNCFVIYGFWLVKNILSSFVLFFSLWCAHTCCRCKTKIKKTVLCCVRLIEFINSEYGNGNSSGNDTGNDSDFNWLERIANIQVFFPFRMILNFIVYQR